MGEVNTFSAVRNVIGKNNPTDADLHAAFAQILTALTRGGKIIPILNLDSATAPTDAAVQAADVGGETEREVYDGMLVAIQSGANLKLYQRVAGAWKYYVAGP